MNSTRILFFILLSCSGTIFTEHPTIALAEFETKDFVWDEKHTSSLTPLDDMPTRAPHTVVFNNVVINGSQVVQGSATILGNLVIDGSVTSSGSNLIIGPTTSTPTAIAIFADSSGKVLDSSNAFVDPSGNVTLAGITNNGNTVSWPSTIGAANTFLGSDGAGNLVFGNLAGSGNVSTALPFTTNNQIITTDFSSGAMNIKQTSVTLDTSNNISGVNVISATTFNGNVTGNATGFTGSLAGDVTGNQNSTVVATVGGQSAANVASATIAANAATNTNTASTIVKRDASGDFAAGTITANLTGNASTATNATNFTGSLSGDVSGGQSTTVVNSVGGQTATDIANTTIAVGNATATNTPSTIVKRDSSGNFSASVITASLAGNANTATSATTATNFSGSLAGDVTGSQGATVVALVGGQTATNVASATIAANNATSSNSVDTIVARDNSGNFAASTITANLTGNATSANSATNFTGALAGDVSGTQGATTVNAVGGQTASAIAAATVLANNATNLNTANAIVKRDASGNFSAGTVSANLTGNVSGNATTATTATNFSGSLIGDVTGSQSATVVSTVDGQTATNVAAATVLANAATNANTSNALVKRDGSGNFIASMITLDGTVTNSTDAATKNYVDTAIASGFSIKQAVLVAGTSDVAISGLQTVDGVSLTTNDRVLLTGQSNSVENGIWLAQSGAWTRPTDFSTGSIAGACYVLSSSGTTQAGSSWVCTTPTAIIGTDPITFTLFIVQGLTTGANVGTGSGQIFRDKTGNDINFKTIATATHLTAANGANEITLSTDATNANSIGTIVARDGSGNFSANTITANLTGNASTATSATNFTGALAGDVTGSQSATVVSLVDGQTATNVAAATVLANAATNANTASTIVKRDGSGNFSAGTITANLTGNASTATSATTATNFSGSLLGDVTGSQSATVVSLVGGQTAANVAAATVLANAATNANTTGAIVRRNGSGNFSAGTITANLTGNVTGNLTGNADTATSASNVGGQTATNVAAATVAANAATATNTASTIVKRDSSGNFATNMITIAGTVLNSTDVTTKSYVDNAVATGFDVHPAARVISLTNITLSGLQTIDDILLTTSDRVLLTGQTSTTENGLWLAQSGAWVRPTDFSNGSTAGTAYVLILEGTLEGGTSWVCTTPTAVIGTDPIAFTLFAQQGLTTGANVGSGTGQIFKNKTGNTLNFKTIAASTHLLATNNTNDVTLSTDATDANTASTIVARDGSGNFSAGTITAALSGNATTATTATDFSGSLVGDVTGSQSATVVSLVDGQTATNVAAATVLANAATNANTASAIVRRDGSGNFSAGTITASLNGNATTATTATTATNFSGSLLGDVTGSQSATVVSLVGGQTAANVAAATVLANAATSADTANTIVRRNGSGNFATNMITLDGTVTNTLDATTKSYVDTLFASGFTLKQAANVISSSNVTLSGLQTIDGYTTIANDRVLLNGQSNNVENGLWLAQSGAWTRPTDFSNGSIAGECYILILYGTLNAGTSWVCSTPTAVIGTNPISFTEFNVQGLVTGANVGSGSGQIFRDKTGNDINFRTLLAGAHMVATTNTNDVTLTTDATNINSVGTIVARDGSGNFSAGTITATLSGNATSATNFSGALLGDVTGSQSATTVALVGGQTAADIAAATVLANAATNANTASTIVRRDGSGNFSAGTITASLNGNASTATTATTATNFSGSLLGDVTGSQSATVVSLVGGQTAANVAAATVLANAATSADTASAIVRRDGSGNFTTNMITLDGVVTNTTDVTTKSYVDNLFATGFSVKQAAIVASTSNVTLSGLQTIDGVTLVANNRVLLVGQTSALENGLWLAQTGAWTRPTDFANGSIAGQCYILTQQGTIGAGIGRLCTTPTAVIGTDSIGFSTVQSVANGANVGTGTGQIFRDRTGNTLNFKTIATGTHVTATNNANDVTLTVDATNANTPSTLVARDGSGNFSAGTITASLNGNATTATTTTNFSGSLIGDVTGTQSATVVSSVGGQTAANVAAATVLANAATNANTASAIVRRDASGNFSAGTITASLTGAASLNVLKAGDTMTGTLILPAGTAAAPSVKFTGSTNTGLSAATANTLSFDTNGTERASISTTAITTALPLILGNLLINQAIQSTTPTVGGSVTTASTTSILILRNVANVGGAGFTVTFPPSPTNGQFFTIVQGSTNSTLLVNTAGTGGASIVNPVTTLNPGNNFTASANGASVTYIYDSTNNAWYRIYRG